MPELPDVEGFRRVAAQYAEGGRIEAVRVEDAGVVRLASAASARTLLSGRYVGTPRRRGKWLVLPTAASNDGAESPPFVLLHFGMTGLLRWCSLEESGHPHDRVVFRLGDGELRYRDMRKLKGLWLARTWSDVNGVLDGLGPDADAVTRGQCRDRLVRTRRQVKSALMDQSLVAGLGNLCADEILWRARIAPRQVTTALDEDGWSALHRSMRSVLRQSAKVARVPDWPSWLTGHRNDPAGQCPRCATGLRHDTVAGRSTAWCVSCQTR